VAEVVTTPVVQAAEVAPLAAAPAASGDDLTRLKGVGPKLSARLKELGVVSFAQIAGWSEADLAAVDAQLGTFAGRPKRDNWIEQAGFLASGDVAGYEAKFGKL
jgi:predicted flap endonuclease-1-like 5' DNA nuclease